MNEPILHHYDTSPYAEKIRRILGFKRLRWRSVALSPILPRPLLEPLVGPYRRTPVLQIGADVYCDTRCIVNVLERLHPEPTLFPAGSRALCYAMTRWVEPRMFVAMAALRFRRPSELEGFMGAGVSGAAFVRDRAPFMRGALDIARLAELEPASFDQINAFLAMLDAALGESGGPFLAGAAASLADFAAGHLVWWLEREPRASDVLDRVPLVLDWHRALEAIGHGDGEPFSAQAALQQARDSDPAALPDHPLTDPYQRERGRSVRLRADDYGRDEVVGEIVFQDESEVVIRREHGEIDVVHLHFPRIGFEILPL